MTEPFKFTDSEGHMYEMVNGARAYLCPRVDRCPACGLIAAEAAARGKK